MRKIRVALSGVAFVILSSVLSAQEAQTARAIVTADSKSNEAAVTVPRETISLLQNRKLQQITGWVPLRGEHSGLQLVVLLDDSARTGMGVQLNDIRTFISNLPPNAEVALGYMRNGTPNLVQGFSSDHTQVAKAVRLPAGTPGGNGSPYFCLSDLVKHWPGGNTEVRREVVMVTDGVDRYSGRRYDPENPYVQAAVSDAQKAGVIVYSIYFRDAGALDRTQWATDGGQNYLTQVSQATGGKVYLQGFGNPVSFGPFLSDIQTKLQNQYELTFTSNSKPGLQSIQVKTSQPNTKLAYPARVPVGGLTPSQ
jgi:hypothetical protein